MNGKNRLGIRGFTLIELLIVISIIGILASLILPVILRSKRQSKVTTCLNNLRQIGIATELYLHENEVFPRGFGGFEIAAEFACNMTDAEREQEMKQRPLYQYLKPSDVFRCPEDKGENFSPDGPNYAPTLFYAFGCSYQFNASTYGAWFTKQDPDGGLGGKKGSWVTNPSRYIVGYEPPARPVWKLIGNPCVLGVKLNYYFHWHFHSGPPTVTDLASDKQLFISPILFVDGHSAKHDFTKAISTDPQYPLEETPDWVWYQPRQ